MTKRDSPVAWHNASQSDWAAHARPNSVYKPDCECTDPVESPMDGNVYDSICSTMISLTNREFLLASINLRAQKL